MTNFKASYRIPLYCIPSIYIEMCNLLSFLSPILSTLEENLCTSHKYRIFILIPLISLAESPETRRPLCFFLKRRKPGF